MKPIVLRPARPADLPVIRQFHAEQNERDGTSYPVPRIFNADGTFSLSVPVALIGHTEGDPTPLQAIWVERRAELMFAGCDPKATAFARRDIEGLANHLRILGYIGLHCDVPLMHAKELSKPLVRAGFAQNDERLAHFYREVVG